MIKETDDQLTDNSFERKLKLSLHKGHVLLAGKNISVGIMTHRKAFRRQ